MMGGPGKGGMLPAPTNVCPQPNPHSNANKVVVAGPHRGEGGRWEKRDPVFPQILISCLE